jgi:hypothetical protein
MFSLQIDGSLDSSNRKYYVTTERNNEQVSFRRNVTDLAVIQSAERSLLTVTATAASIKSQAVQSHEHKATAYSLKQLCL